VDRNAADEARASFPAAAVPARTGEHGRAPYAILAIIQASAGTFAALYVGVTDDPTLRTADIVAAVVLLLMALFTWFVAPRMRDEWGLGFSLWVVEMLALLGMLAVHSAEGQMTVGLGLVLLGVFAGWFRPRPRLFVHLGLLTGGLLLTAALNPHLTSDVTYAVLISILVGVTLMVSSLAQRQRELAMRDALTGAFNRRGLDLLSPPLLAAAARAKAPVTVGILDLDDFKGFNDRHGHLAADVMLVSIAAAWMSEVRGSDVVARFGGDEFAVVLPGSTPQDAEAAVERVRARATAPFSIGLATWIPGEDVYDALTRADEALFDAKRRRLADEAPGREAIDPLTGVWNRRFLHAPPPSALRAAHVDPCTVVVIDLVEFIRYNDENGHQAGDAVIEQVAQLWLSAIPEHGAVIRVGGDEFAIVLPGLDPAAAEALADSLLARSPHPWSSGYAAWTGEVPLHEAARAADDDCYRRRGGGSSVPVR